MVTGSNPVLTTMSKRYSESSNQDFKNDSAKCLRREWDIMGTKGTDTIPPSSVDVLSGKTRRVFERKNQEYLLIGISGGETWSGGNWLPYKLGGLLTSSP